MKRIVAFLPTLLLSSTLAHASSEDAWKKSREVMVQACVNASHLSKVRVLGEPIEYDDNTGYSALLLEGRYPQQHMKNKRGRELCLFQRSSGRASVSEADKLRWVK
ncbi:hypothetical protein ACTUSZ_14500 [Pantoea eucalypti]|jgi:hypothetical protein|uniref:hypothetical protein n=1 Tax=Pantoea TaxID=53335 RepID=UPI0001E08AF4|nr:MULTISPECIES: hypothetical protein [Pantoea]QXG53897.1 hypothetical protein KTJ90_14905 [Pantoea jilinensis]AWP33838.1 hypothetical protein B9D02_15070 [Pantoea vagans]EFM21092.1 conserved hypothetical protein [Pantoea sp. aB]ELP25916.1 hypothetical protein F385_1027 [Pantoea agglomerans 299R]MBD9553703.1 hypothetical protein [Pantoea sp. PNT01]